MNSLLADKPAASRPFIKWAGGKTRLLPVLLPFVPESFRRYHEPFLGGGAFFFAVHSRGTSPAFISDFNDDLVNVWQTVQSDPKALHRRLAKYVANDSEEFFYSVRAKTHKDAVERAAHFIYLNKTAWNGLYRVNRWGEFNVPWGARDFSPPKLEALEAAAAELADVSIASSDFREALAQAEEGDFVYLDPPYLKVSDTSKFNGYTQQRFREEDLEDLATVLHELTDRGVQWLLSNRDSERLRKLFSSCEITRLTVRRSVAAQNRRNVEPANSPEAVVSNRLALA